MNYYQASPDSPFHLSVGAVPIDKKGNVYCHYWKQKREFTDLYSLMRETMEQGETIEKTFERGLMEEFGMTGKVVDYVGSITAVDEWFGEINRPTNVEKTTLYFLVDVISIDESKRLVEDEESDSQITCIPIHELIEKMEEVFNRTKINYFAEAKILKSVLNLLKNSEDVKL